MYYLILIDKHGERAEVAYSSYALAVCDCILDKRKYRKAYVTNGACVILFRAH